jgi:hypothetical protein
MVGPPIDYAAKKLAATLVVRRRINATRKKLFAAWTQPELLVRWWGRKVSDAPPALEKAKQTCNQSGIDVDYKRVPGSRLV